MTHKCIMESWWVVTCKYLRDEYKVHCDWKDDYLLSFTADTKISLTDDEKNWL